MSDSTSGVAWAVLRCWRTHNRWLCLFALGSIGAAVIAWNAARGPDGRDAFYVAVAIEWLAWGTLNLWFGIAGTRETRRLGTPADDGDSTVVKGRQIARLLRLNRWLNALWLAMGVALLAWGWHAWSASLCGHGVGVLFQAVSLTIADEVFLHRLQRAARPASAARAI